MIYLEALSLIKPGPGERLLSSVDSLDFPAEGGWNQGSDGGVGGRAAAAFSTGASSR